MQDKTGVKVIAPTQNKKVDDKSFYEPDDEDDVVSFTSWIKGAIAEVELFLFGDSQEDL